jgi:hypothetical protein
MKKIWVVKYKITEKKLYYEYWLKFAQKFCNTFTLPLNEFEYVIDIPKTIDLVGKNVRNIYANLSVTALLKQAHTGRE